MSDQPRVPRPLRPLLPAPLGNAPNGGQPDGTADSTTRTSPTSPKKQGSARSGHATRQQIAVACTNCQKKKCKCDGKRPCQTCDKQGIDCIYDIESGFTRGQALKRKNEALSEDNRNLKFIVQGLRGGSDTEAGEILRRIRESGDVDEAVAFINQASLLLLNSGHADGSSPETQQSDAGSATKSRRRLTSTSVDPRAPTLQMLLNPSMSDGISPQKNPANSSLASATSAQGTSMQGVQRTQIAPEEAMSMQRMLRQGTQGIEVSAMSTKAASPTARSSSEQRTSSSSSSATPLQSATRVRPTQTAEKERQKVSKSLARWISWNSSGSEQSVDMEAAGPADRLNALLDGLSFIGNRPAGSFSASAEPGSTYLPYLALSAHPWTSITDDDDFVSQLVMLFFTWEQPWYHYINMTSFLEDMHSVTADTSLNEAMEKEFCSPALVNAIMAMGALSSRHPLAYAVPGDPTTRGQQYLNEAERLIDIERRGRPKITTLQAMWVTMWYRSCSGFKFRSNKYHEAIYEMYDEMDLGGHHTRPHDYDTNRLSRLHWQAKCEVIWGIYTHDAILAIANGYRVRIKRPLIEQTFEDPSASDTPAARTSNLWWPFPDFRVPQPAHRQTVLCEKITLVDIIHDMFEFMDALNSNEETDEYLLAEATRIYHQYTNWYDALPAIFSPQGSTMPSVLCLRSSYHIGVITLFRSLQDVDIAYGDMWNHPRCKVLTHAQSLMATMNTLRDNWTLYRHCYGMQAHWIPAFALLFYLEPGEPSSEVFTQIIMGLHEVGQKWPVAAWMLQALDRIADEYGLQIPYPARKWMKIDSSRSRDVNASDVMLPITIPLSNELSNPLLKGLKSGVYLEDLNSVLSRLEQFQMRE